MSLEQVCRWEEGGVNRNSLPKTRDSRFDAGKKSLFMLASVGVCLVLGGKGG